MTNKEEIIVNGIVLRIVPYGENDGILTVLTMNGLVSFKARGILKPNSKNLSSCVLYTESEFILQRQKNDNLTLVKGRCLNLQSNLYDSLDYMCCAGLISESILHFLHEVNSNMFLYFKAMLDGIKNSFDIFTLTAITLAKIVIESGYGLNVFECVRCGSKKKIVSLNYHDGGFICLKCLKDYEKNKDIEYLKTIKYIFSVNVDKFYSHIIKKDLSIKIIKELMEFIKENFDYKKLVFYDLFEKSY